MLIDLTDLRLQIYVGKLLGVQNRRSVISICQSGVQIGSTITEGNLRINLTFLHCGQAVVECGICGIVVFNQAHAVEVHKNHIGVPRQNLLGIDVECASLAGGIRQIVRVNQLKGAVVGLRALKTMAAFE